MKRSDIQGASMCIIGLALISAGIWLSFRGQVCMPMALTLFGVCLVVCGQLMFEN